MRWAPRSKESTATVYSGATAYELGLLGGGREDAGHVRVGEDVLDLGGGVVDCRSGR